MKNLQNLNSYRKGYVDFCYQTLASHQNGHVLTQMVFHRFSPKIPLFSKNLFNNKISCTN